MFQVNYNIRDISHCYFVDILYSNSSVPSILWMILYWNHIRFLLFITLK